LVTLSLDSYSQGKKIKTAVFARAIHTGKYDPPPFKEGYRPKSLRGKYEKGEENTGWKCEKSKTERLREIEV
jgi:hypothetical protein